MRCTLGPVARGTAASWPWKRHAVSGLDGTAPRVTWDVVSPGGKRRQVHPAAGDPWVMPGRHPQPRLV